MPCRASFARSSRGWSEGACQRCIDFIEVGHGHLDRDGSERLPALDWVKSVCAGLQWPMQYQIEAVSRPASLTAITSPAGTLTSDTLAHFVTSLEVCSAQIKL